MDLSYCWHTKRYINPDIGSIPFCHNGSRAAQWGSPCGTWDHVLRDALLSPRNRAINSSPLVVRNVALYIEPHPSFWNHSRPHRIRPDVRPMSVCGSVSSSFITDKQGSWDIPDQLRGWHKMFPLMWSYTMLLSWVLHQLLIKSLEINLG